MRIRGLAIVLVCSMAGTTCGTQIGNGVRGKTRTGSTGPKSADSADAAFAEGGISDISGDSNGAKKFGPSQEGMAQQHIFLRDVSPAVEMAAGTFKSSAAGGSAFKVLEPNSTGHVHIRFSGTDTFVTLKADPAVGTHGIAVDLQGFDAISAGPITSAKNGDVTTRSVTYSDGYKTAWDVDASGKVVEIRVTNPTGDYELKISYIPATVAEKTPETAVPEAPQAEAEASASASASTSASASASVGLK